jgi:hypothetical protein
MKFLIAIILSIVSLIAQAAPFDGWTDNEKAVFVASELSLLADYKSTSYLLYPSRGFKELNPILGEQPGHDRLTAYFLTYMIGNYFIADYLGHENRTRWLLTLTIVESLAVGNNISIGAKISF